VRGPAPLEILPSDGLQHRLHLIRTKNPQGLAQARYSRRRNGLRLRAWVLPAVLHMISLVMRADAHFLCQPRNAYATPPSQPLSTSPRKPWARRPHPPNFRDPAMLKSASPDVAMVVARLRRLGWEIYHKCSVSAARDLHPRDIPKM